MNACCPECARGAECARKGAQMNGGKNFGFAGVQFVEGFGFVEDPIRAALGPNPRTAAFNGDQDVMMISGLGQAAPGNAATSPVAGLDMTKLVLYSLALLGVWTALKWLGAKVA